MGRAVVWSREELEDPTSRTTTTPAGHRGDRVGDRGVVGLHRAVRLAHVPGPGLVLLICTVPFAFVAGPFWRGEHPRALRQPWQGLAVLALALLVGALVAVVLVAVVLVAVVLVVAYAITAVAFRLFRQDFLKGTPVYSASLDPKGPFDAWTALVGTCLAAALLAAHVDLWPISLRGGLMAQPRAGLCWAAPAVTLSAVATYLGIHVVGMAPPQFLATVTVPFLFGSIVVLNMLEATSFRGLRQPGRGLAAAQADRLSG
jgi:hypothetical protein